MKMSGKSEFEEIKLKLMELERIKSESDTDIFDISGHNSDVDARACRGCLITGVKLSSLHENGLRQLLGDFTGIPVVPTDGYPQLVCSMCRALLRKFFTFRMRCHSALYTLQQMQANNVKITTDSLSTIERAHLRYNLLKSETQCINYDGTTENTSDAIKDDNDIKTVEEIEPLCLGNVDLTEDDDKPLQHFVTAMSLDAITPKVKDDSSDADIYAEELIDERPLVKRKKITRTAIKKKQIKTENKKRTAKKQTTKESKTSITKSKNSKLEYSKEEVYLKTISNILRKIWHENKNCNIVDVWEMVYQESLSVKDVEEGKDDKTQKLSPIDMKSLQKSVDRCGTTKQHIVKLIELTRKLSKLYNMEVKFLSVEDHRREIEDMRSSEKFANAPYKCEFCCKVYVYEDTYRRHMLSHDATSGDVECEICRYRFKNRKRYMNHFHIYHTKKIICKECGVVNRAWNFAKQHFKWHGGVTTVCEQCGKHFPEKKLYCMHVRAVHRELATTLCLLCGDTYNGHTGLRMHMDKVHRQAIRCDSCGGLFRTAEAHTAHVDNVCRPGESSCPMCGDNFPSEELMRQHYDEQHKKQFTCAQCDRNLPSLEKYKRHINRCLLPKGYERRKREIGKEKGVKQIYNLNLMCETCGKGNFKCFSTLRNHQRVHTGERPFQCDVCQKSFRELQFLKNHMKTHTDERRYKCPFCPKAFRQMGHRAAHILTHTKERPFPCTTCSKRYTGLTALKEHINTAHRGLPPRQRQKHNKQEL